MRASRLAGQESNRDGKRSGLLVHTHPPCSERQYSLTLFKASPTPHVHALSGGTSMNASDFIE